MKLLDNYRAFWHFRPVRPAVLWSVVGRLPLYMTPLAVALLSIQAGDQLAFTGLLLGAYSIGSAIAGPLVARWMDRAGQTLPLITTGVGHVISILIFVLAPFGQVGEVIVVALAGATIPPTSASIRAMWANLPLGDTGRRGAFALEAILGEIFVVSGPLALAAALVWVGPGSALIVGGVLTAIGAIGVSATTASRGWIAELQGARHPLGPLAKPTFVWLVAVLLLAAAGGGTMSLLLPAFSEDQGDPGAAGLIFAMWGVGSVIGGLVFGSRTPSPRRAGLYLIFGMTAVCVGLALPIFAWNVPSMAAAMILGGVAIAPSSIVEYEMIQRLAPREHLTEGFTWVQTANVAGSAVGAQIAGVVATKAGLTVAFTTGPILLAAAILAAWIALPAWQRTLTEQDDVGNNNAKGEAEA